MKNTQKKKISRNYHLRCGHIVAYDVSWARKRAARKRMLCFQAAQTGKHLLRTQNVSEQKSETLFVSRTLYMCPQQMLHARENGETFVSATMYSKQCVFVCQGLHEC